VTGPKNERDWAWWAGTSFAAPILTGLLAAILSRPGEFFTVQQAIERMYTESAILELQPQLLEDRLPEVQQTS
jgi:subtilisin family serine protease